MLTQSLSNKNICNDKKNSAKRKEIEERRIKNHHLLGTSVKQHRCRDFRPPNATLS